jgi:hypothetical protein
VPSLGSSPQHSQVGSKKELRTDTLPLTTDKLPPLHVGHGSKRGQPLGVA